MANNSARLQQAFQDLEVPEKDPVRAVAQRMTDILTEYSVFWGEKPFGEKYIEWSNGTNHSITLDF